MQLVADEEVKQRQLQIMKRRATSLLVAVSVVFVVAWIFESRAAPGTAHFVWGAIRQTAEAAMVGGLADWFAVTALFRHPLGLKIPHTAIVAKRKDRVGRTLGAFVQRNFLAREVIESRLRSLRVGERVGEWLSSPENARTISRHTAGALVSAAHLVRDDEIDRLIGSTVAERVRAVKVTPIIGRLLQVLTEGNRHQELLSELLHMITRVVDDNRSLIRDRIDRESPWWLPEAVDDKIYQKVLGAIDRTMHEIERDERHPLRARFDVALRKFIDRLESSPEMSARIEAWKEEMLATDTARRFSASLWADGKTALAAYAERPETGSAVGDATEHAITAFGERILTDPALLARVEGFIVDIAVELVARYQGEVADLIAHTVASWDPDVTSRRVELAIGRDLQFIRINGTIVGGLAGLVLYLITELW